MICGVEHAGAGPDWAEGFRLVTRMASLVLEHVVEKGDPAFPVLFRSQNPWSKLIGDNPDTDYYFCTIDAQYDYRVWGNKGNAPYVTQLFFMNAGGPANAHYDGMTKRWNIFARHLGCMRTRAAA